MGAEHSSVGDARLLQEIYTAVVLDAANHNKYFQLSPDDGQRILRGDKWVFLACRALRRQTATFPEASCTVQECICFVLLKIMYFKRYMLFFILKCNNLYIFQKKFLDSQACFCLMILGWGATTKSLFITQNRNAALLGWHMPFTDSYKEWTARQC